MKKVVGIVLLFFFSISACSSVNTAVVTPQSKHPTVIQHTAPDLKVDRKWLKEGGCSLSEHNYGSCSPDSPIRKFGCEEVRVNDFYGGLPYPAVLCLNYSNEPLGAGFTQAGCYLSNHRVALLVYRNGGYSLIREGKLGTITAPIDSPEEALSYVIASTDYYPLYDIEIEDYYYYYVDEIEETFIQETRNGYLLHLFYDVEPVCSCAEHYTDMVDVHVNGNGEIDVVRSSHFYMVESCVD